MNGVDHLADVAELQCLDVGIEGEHLIIDDRADANVIDVVGGMERVALDVVRRSGQVKAEAFEKHDGGIDTRASGGNHPFPKSIEVVLIKSREIELRFAILGSSRSGSGPGLRRHTKVHISLSEVAAKLFPAPEPDEVV